MFKSRREEQPVSTALALLEEVGPKPGSKHVMELNGSGFVVDDAKRGNGGLIDEVSRQHSTLVPSAIPGYKDLTHPDRYLEAFLPVGQGDMTGRLVDITIHGSISGDGGSYPIADRMSLVDEAYVQAEHVMRADVEEKGIASRWFNFVNHASDILTLWEIEQPERLKDVRANGPMGRIILRGILDPRTAHPEDIFYEVAQIKPGAEAEDDSFDYKSGFVKNLAIAAEKEIEEELKRRKKDREPSVAHFTTQSEELREKFKEFIDGDSDNVRRFLAALGKSYTDPLDYGDVDRIPRKELNEKQRDFVKAAREVVDNHVGSTSEPLRMFLRAFYMFERYEYEEDPEKFIKKYKIEISDENREKLKVKMKAETRADKIQRLNSIKVGRKRVWQSVLTGISYMNVQHEIISTGDRQQRKLRPPGRLFNSPRFEITVLDDIDAQMAEATANALATVEDHDLDDVDTRVYKELLAHIAGTSRDRVQRYVVRAINERRDQPVNGLMELQDLDPEEGSGGLVGVLADMGDAIDVDISGDWYPQEMYRTMIRPYKNKSNYFGETGNAMPGIKKAFEVHTAEKANDPVTPTNSRFVIMSGRNNPWCVIEYIDSQLSEGASVPELTDGSVTLDKIYGMAREQTWRVAINSARAHRMVLSPVRLQNGDTFVLAAGKKKVIDPADGSETTMTYTYSDKGKLSSQKSKKRELDGTREPASRHKVQQIPKYGNSQTGNLVTGRKAVGIDRHGNTKYEPIIRDNRVVELIFAEGAVYLKRNKARQISIVIPSHPGRDATVGRKK